MSFAQLLRYFCPVVVGLLVLGIGSESLAQSCSASADYNLQNTRTSSVGSPPALADIGPGTSTFVTDTVNGTSRTVLQFPQGNGVRVQPTTGTIGNGTYTIVALFRFDNIGGYRRVMDFKNGVTDNGLYFLNGKLNFFPLGSAAFGSTVITAGAYVQVVVTRTASGTVAGYVNGVQQFSFDDSANQDAVIDANNNLRFFQDNTSGSAQGEESPGAVSRIRLFSCALTPAEVAALSGANCTPSPAGLVSWYAGDGNALDSRSRNDAVFQGTAAYSNGGEVGQAFVLDGSTYLKANASTTLDAGATGSGLSIEAWIDPTDLSVGRPIVEWSSALNGANSIGVHFYASANPTTNGQRNLYANLRDTAGNPHILYSPVNALSPSSFQHVAVTYDKASGNASLYVNGVAAQLNGTASTVINLGTFIPATANDLYIGARVSNEFGDAGSRFVGLLDEIGIYDRALTATDVTAIFAAGVSGRCKPTATTTPAGLTYWLAGDGSAADLSGNGNTGTLSGGVNYSVAKVGQGLSFDGSGVVTVPDSASLDPTAQVTMESWVYPTADSIGSNAMAIIMNKEIVGNVQYEMGRRLNSGGCPSGTGIATGNFVVAFSAPLGLPDGCGGWVDSGANLPLGVWSHVAATYDGVNLRTYVNGSLTRTLPASGSLTTSNGSLRVGGRLVNPEVWVGQLDEVSLYNRGLSGSEVASIFNAGLAGKLTTATTATGFAQSPSLGRIQSQGPFARKGSVSRTATLAAPQTVSVTVGDATVNFPSVTTAGKTQEIPLDASLLPTPPGGTPIGLTYDIATTSVFTGSPTVCFHVAAVTTSAAFSKLRIRHFEGGVWVDRTNMGSIDFATQTLCTVPLSSLSPFEIVSQSPSAANVGISGRVLTASGAGLRGALVMMTDTNGKTRTVISNAFGYYSFSEVPSGEIYTLVVSSRRFTFAPRVVSVNDQLADVDFTALY